MLLGSVLSVHGFLYIHFPGERSVCSSVPGCCQGSRPGSREEQRQRWSYCRRPSSRCLRNTHHCPPGSWAQVTYTWRIIEQTSVLLAKLLWIIPTVHFNRRRGGKYAVGSACIGGGQGIAIILEKCWRRRRKKKRTTNSRQDQTSEDHAICLLNTQ